MARSNRFVTSFRGERAKGRVIPSVAVMACLAFADARGQTLLWHFDDNCADLDLMGDVDGDGVNDIVADAQSLSAVVILSGVDGHTITTYAAGSSFYGGFTVAGVGDYNRDGYPDLAFGDPNFVDSLWAPVGYVTLLSGKDGAQIYHYQGKNYRWNGFESNVGTCIRGIGDGDGDGVSDYVWGMYADPVDPLGGSYGRSELHGNFSLELGGNFDELFYDSHHHAHTLAPIGDVNGDGLDDIAVSIKSSNSHVGVVTLRSGSTGAEYRKFVGASAKERFGGSVGSCLDLDGDGVRELLVGAIGDATHGDEAGRVDVYSGASGALLLQLFGDLAGRRFGVDVDGLGDVDGDGLPDLLVASFGTYGVADGRIEVFSGATGSELMRVDEAAVRVRGAGDLDGDGIDDFVATPGQTSVHAWKVGLTPTVSSVSPSRIRYDQVGALAVHGAGFTADPNLSVLIDATPATNVVVSSYTDLTCTAPAGLLPGPHDVTVTNKFGSATLAGGLLLTPAMFIDGDATLGSTVFLRYEFDPLDSTFAICGLPPQQSIPTPPFGGLLGIVPFTPLFTLMSFPGDEFVVHANIPNDPALSGVTVLFQSLTGPNFKGSGKDAAWSNVAVLAIQ